MIAKAMIPPLVQAMFDAAHDSLQQLRARFSNVRFAGFNDDLTAELVRFDFDGETYIGEKRGRIAEYVTLDEPDCESNRSVALQVYMQRDACNLRKL